MKFEIRRFMDRLFEVQNVDLEIMKIKTLVGQLLSRMIQQQLHEILKWNHVLTEDGRIWTFRLP